MNDHDMIHCKEKKRQLARAVAIMHRLRAPGGCPWDAEQTHESIVPNLIEECYECIDAIHANDMVHLREELGDVLLQVVLCSEIASEHRDFTDRDVTTLVTRKMREGMVSLSTCRSER